MQKTARALVRCKEVLDARIRPRGVSRKSLEAVPSEKDCDELALPSVAQHVEIR